MIGIPEGMSDEARNRLKRIRDLAEFGLSSDQAYSANPERWIRTVLQAFGDITEECRRIEPALSTYADSSDLMTVKEISEAARVSRETVYKRRNR